MPRAKGPLHSLPALGATALLVMSASAVEVGIWRPLFNGKDLTGWEHVGEGAFVVDSGTLKTRGGMGLLWYTGEQLGDVTIRVVYRNPGGANSGVFVRIPEKPNEPWMPVNRGYEIQIDDHGDEYHRTGVLYSLTQALAKSENLDEWNTMEVTLEGDRTVVKVNGLLVTDFREGQPVPPKKEEWEPDRGPRPLRGYIGLQNHGAGEVVYFREVSVRSLQR